MRGYNDVEAVTAEEIEIKRRYIRDNPRKRIIQGRNHRCFRKHRHAHSRNWTVQRVMAAITNDRDFGFDSIRREKAMLNILERLNNDAVVDGAGSNSGAIITQPSGRHMPAPQIGLDYIGNDALLAAESRSS